MELIQCCAVIAVILLWRCFSSLSVVVQHIEMINKCALDIRLETEGLSRRLSDIEALLDTANDQVRDIASVAKDYDDEILSPMSKQRRDIEFDREIFG